MFFKTGLEAAATWMKDCFCVPAASPSINLNPSMSMSSALASATTQSVVLIVVPSSQVALNMRKLALFTSMGPVRASKAAVKRGLMSVIFAASTSISAPTAVPKVIVPLFVPLPRKTIVIPATSRSRPAAALTVVVCPGRTAITSPAAVCPTA